MLQQQGQQAALSVTIAACSDHWMMAKLWMRSFWKWILQAVLAGLAAALACPAWPLWPVFRRYVSTWLWGVKLMKEWHGCKTFSHIDLLTPASVRRSAPWLGWAQHDYNFKGSRRDGLYLNCCSAAGVGRGHRSQLWANLVGLQLQTSLTKAMPARPVEWALYDLRLWTVNRTAVLGTGPSVKTG